MADREGQSDMLLCHGCGADLTPGEGSFWVVRIDAVRDPSPPVIDTRESMTSIAAEYEALLARLSEQSERELMDQVHRRLILHLCSRCFGRWIERPADNPDESDRD